MRTALRMLLAVAGLAVVACGGRSAVNAPAQSVTAAPMKKLGLLMKNDMNPAFSKLSFLVFHGKDLGDRTQVKQEIQVSMTTLRKAIEQLRQWDSPPTESEQGREVFFTYANSLDSSAQKFEDAMARNDQQIAAEWLSRIARTCNNCHHFFRLNLEDSDEGSGRTGNNRTPDAGMATRPQDGS